MSTFENHLLEAHNHSPAFVETLEALRQDHAPQGALENLLIAWMASLQFNLDRTAACEAAFLSPRELDRIGINDVTRGVFSALSSRDAALHRHYHAAAERLRIAQSQRSPRK